MLGLVAACGLSLVAARGGYSPLQCAVFIAVASLVVEHGLWACGLRSCSSRALEQSLGSVVVGMGLVAAGHVGSSRTRDRTCVPCIGSLILIHSASGEAPEMYSFTVLEARSPKICWQGHVLSGSFGGESVPYFF